MWDRCRLVGGASGAGKSSLLRAGLAPRLSGIDLAAAGRWHWVLFTPDVDPLRQLTRHLAPVLGGWAGATPDMLADVLADPARLAELMRSARGTGIAARMLLIVDQFEQIFALCQDDRQRTACVAAIAELSDTAGGDSMRVVLGIRAAVYGRAAAFPAGPTCCWPISGSRRR